MRQTQLTRPINRLTGRGPLTLCLLTLLALGGVAAPPPARVAPARDEPRVCTERLPASLGAAGLRDYFWKNKTQLSVSFIGGSEALRAQVKNHAPAWSRHAGIRFVFVDRGPSDIRVSFVPDGRTWSYIGSSAEREAEDKATMNFGWFDEDTTTEVEFRRTILHEFGHALGLVHEHQSPRASIRWKKGAVYEYYRENYGWNRNVVDDNIFKRYDTRLTDETAYDPTSIMHYPIPAAFTIDGRHVEWNTSLSAGDIAFIRRVYPRRPGR